MTRQQLVKSAVVGLVVAGAIAAVMIATATPVISPGRPETASCMTDVATVQTAVDTYRNTPRMGSPPGSADEQGRPGPPPTMAQLMTYGYLRYTPNACASYAIDGTTGVVSAVAKDGATVPSVNPPLMK